MLSHRTRQRVLDRDHRTFYRSSLYALEDLDRTRAGHHLRSRQHRFRRFVAERTEFSLNRNFHETLPPVETGLAPSETRQAASLRKRSRQLFRHDQGVEMV